MSANSNSDRQFRFAFFTTRYEETVAFYRDLLNLKCVESWDHPPDNHGMVFAAASGRIEVLARPRAWDAEQLFDERAPQGAFMVIEVEDVDAYYAQLKESGVVINRELLAQSWGHKSFVVRDPNGLKLYFYSELAASA